MAYYVRLMRQEDIPRVTEIDHEAFPTMWPPANYGRELQTCLAHYIVAYKESRTAEKAEIPAAPEENSPSLISRVRQLFSSNRLLSTTSPVTDQQCVVGFAGHWMMADEAHITNIAVRKSHRRQGIGEHLLISMIDLAMELKARILTLEVRASNIAAQNLYYKYGFTQADLRQGYYTDNREDALAMSLEDVTSASFQTRLTQLRKAHSRKCGVAFYHIGR